jgi:cholesterol oxidase
LFGKICIFVSVNRQMFLPKANQKHLERRDFLKLSGMAAAGLAVARCTPNIPVLNNQRCLTGSFLSRKIIIIGSGFGGSIAARRLTESGQEVTLLERGREWTTDGTTKVFSDAFGTDNRAAWLSLENPLPFGLPISYARKYIGVLEKFKGQNMSVNAAACLGGGSVTFGGIWAKPSAAVFNRIFSGSVSYTELDTAYFPMVLQDMICTEIPDTLAQHPLFRYKDIFKQHNEAAGLQTVKLQNNFDWSVLQEEINGTKVKSAVAGECVFGTNSGVKITTNDTYLKRAKETGRLEIKTQTIVREIVLNCDNRYLIYADEIDESGSVTASVIYSCAYVFLAAGSVGTSVLLTKAKAKNTIPDLNGFVGQGWGNNGSSLFLRGGINLATGAQQSFPPVYAAQDVSNPDMPFYIENFPFNFSGIDLRAIGYNFMGLHHTRGYFKYNGATDTADLIYPQRSLSNQQVMNAAAKAILDRIISQNGGALNGLLGAIPLDTSTYHPLGGAVLAKATDDYGRIKNNAKLYVIDGALLPGAAGCNPAWTICALAERNMEHILNNDF